jgi:hypothetical protein
LRARTPFTWASVTPSWPRRAFRSRIFHGPPPARGQALRPVLRREAAHPGLTLEQVEQIREALRKTTRLDALPGLPSLKEGACGRGCCSTTIRRHQGISGSTRAYDPDVPLQWQGKRTTRASRAAADQGSPALAARSRIREVTILDPREACRASRRYSSDVRETFAPQLRYRFASFPLASRMPMVLSSSSFSSREGCPMASRSSSGDQVPGAAWGPTRCARRTRLGVFAISAVLSYGPHGEDIVRLAYAELHMRAFEHPAAAPEPRHPFALL